MASFDGEDWATLVAQIRADDERAAATLYNKLRKASRYKIWKQLAPDIDVGTGVDDCLHDVFAAVLAAIRAGQLRDPERLMGFIRTVRIRQVAQAIEERVDARRIGPIGEQHAEIPNGSDSTDAAYERKEERSLAWRALAELSAADRRILIAFYVEERPWREIADEMGLTHTQFRLRKSRAKARLGAIGKKLLTVRRTTRPVVCIDCGSKSRRKSASPETRAA